MSIRYKFSYRYRLFQLLHQAREKTQVFLGFILFAQKASRAGATWGPVDVVYFEVKFETLAECEAAAIVHLIQLFPLGDELSPLHKLAAQILLGHLDLFSYLFEKVPQYDNIALHINLLPRQ